MMTSVMGIQEELTSTSHKTSGTGVNPGGHRGRPCRVPTPPAQLHGLCPAWPPSPPEGTKGGPAERPPCLLSSTGSARPGLRHLPADSPQARRPWHHPSPPRTRAPVSLLCWLSGPKCTETNLRRQFLAEVGGAPSQKPWRDGGDRQEAPLCGPLVAAGVRPYLPPHKEQFQLRGHPAGSEQGPVLQKVDLVPRQKPRAPLAEPPWVSQVRPAPGG